MKSGPVLSTHPASEAVDDVDASLLGAAKLAEPEDSLGLEPGGDEPPLHNGGDPAEENNFKYVRKFAKARRMLRGKRLDEPPKLNK